MKYSFVKNGIMKKSIKAFIRKLNIEGKSENTIKNYLCTLDMLRTFTQSDNLKICSSKINDFMFYLREKKLSNNSLLRHYSCLKTFFSYSNLKIDNFKIKKTSFVRNELSDENVSKLLRKTTLNTKLLIMILAYTGLRVSEVLQVKKSDFLENKFLVIGKGNKKRWVYFPKDKKAKLFQYINNLGIKNGKLFDYNSASYLHRIISKAGKDILDRRLTPHDFRHYFASRMINNGMDIYTLSKLLGHSSVTTTSIYAHLDQALVEERFAKYII